MLNTNKTIQHEYGSKCAASDMDPEEFQKAKENLKNLTADRISIERTTTNLTKSPVSGSKLEKN